MIKKRLNSETIEKLYQSSKYLITENITVNLKKK